MRLADFIEMHHEQILSEWEEFARTHVPVGEVMDVAALRNHAAEMLDTISTDLRSHQTEVERAAKSRGDAEQIPGRRDTAAETHGGLRAEAGFTLGQMVSEFRALRASVLQLWRAAGGGSGPEEFEDMTRFNESIDQALTESLARHTRDLEHSKEMFLATLGHDVRTPLGAIMMSATALLMNEDLSQPEHESVSCILSSGTRIMQIVGDLLDFTRTRLGAGIPLARSDMDLEEVCRQTVDEIAAYHPVRDVRFEATGHLHGSWDGARLAQAVSNLLGNAIQHGSVSSPVTVAVRGEPDEVTVAVHNHGPAIPRIHLHEIFNPLKRIDTEDRASDAWGSMGLGLYIANEIVKGHGGRVDVESSDVTGTTFTVRLPRQASSTPPRSIF